MPLHPASITLLTLDLFHSVSLSFVSPFHWLHGIAIASFWIAPIQWDLWPVRLHLCVWFRGSWLGRVPVRAVLCCFPFSRSSLWRPLWSLFGFVWPPFHTMLSPLFQYLRHYWAADHLALFCSFCFCLFLCFCLWLVCVLFRFFVWFVWFFLLASWQAYRTLYRSCLSSLL